MAAYTAMSQDGPFSFVAYTPRIWPRRRTITRLTKSLCEVMLGVATLLMITICIVAIVHPSYTHPPPHYFDVIALASGSKNPGRVNPRHEKVFIAATLYDPNGDVVSGGWGKDVLELIHLLGPENTFLSVYESDSGEIGRAALEAFGAKVPCNNSLVYEPTIVLDDPDLVVLPDGSSAVKRITYLATARNRALKPLEDTSLRRFDKILYLNDVIFTPLDAVQLLLSTNQEYGTTRYRAACAVDFQSPFLFYDTFATRDHQGYSMGVPLFPWFSSAGDAVSRKDVLEQRDAVRVKSCWGGMIAFDAAYFQPRSTKPFTLSAPELATTFPVRFRSEPDLYWEHSECCLVNADLASFDAPEFPNRTDDAGIYMNPYVRTAYTQRTFAWIGFAQSFEVVMVPLQAVINKLVQLPYLNTRRTVEPGTPLWKTVYQHSSSNGAGQSPGEWGRAQLPANPGGFCGVRNLLVRRLHAIEGAAEHNWVTIGVPKEILEAEALEDSKSG